MFDNEASNRDNDAALDAQEPHRLTLKDDDDGDMFGRFQWQADAIQGVLDAFREWGSEGYYDADEQAEIRERRTKALDDLQKSQDAFLLFWAECSCGWKSPRFDGESEAESAWELHADDPDGEKTTAKRVTDHELWLATPAADYLFEGRGE